MIPRFLQFIIKIQAITKGFIFYRSKHFTTMPNSTLTELLPKNIGGKYNEIFVSRLQDAEFFNFLRFELFYPVCLNNDQYSWKFIQTFYKLNSPFKTVSLELMTQLNKNCLNKSPGNLFYIDFNLFKLSSNKLMTDSDNSNNFLLKNLDLLNPCESKMSLADLLGYDSNNLQTANTDKMFAKLEVDRMGNVESLLYELYFDVPRIGKCKLNYKPIVGCPIWPWIKMENICLKKSKLMWFVNKVSVRLLILK